jgi:hypothetical protein
MWLEFGNADLGLFHGVRPVLRRLLSVDDLDDVGALIPLWAIRPFGSERLAWVSFVVLV